jgi:phosphatidylglycerophosphatase A
MATLILWVAQGFGTGRVPIAPGTFGSLVGIFWFLLLLKTGSLWGYLGGTIAGLALSVWLCGKAEKILNQIDPGSIVLDEIAAMPICFLPWVVGLWLRDGQWPGPELFWHANAWAGLLIIFILFRLFDIAKPWPIRRSQRLSGGWGVTMDDVLAAIFVAALSGLVFFM